MMTKFTTRISSSQTCSSLVILFFLVGKPTCGAAAAPSYPSRVTTTPLLLTRTGKLRQNKLHQSMLKKTTSMRLLCPSERRRGVLYCREIKADVKDDIEKLKTSMGVLDNTNSKYDDQVNDRAAASAATATTVVTNVPIRDPLPPTTRADVLRACVLVSSLIAGTGVALRKYAASKLTISGADASIIEAFTGYSNLHITPKDIGLTLGVALGVTLMRKIALSIWDDYRWAADRSNEQVLRPLNNNIVDIGLIALLPGISEELLFRGALIPAVFPDWRGVVIAALTFGVLHNSGGRNLASAAFATLAGGAYGASFIATQNLLVPIGAHSLSNLMSAILWLNEHPIATKYSNPDRINKSGDADNSSIQQKDSISKKVRDEDNLRRASKKSRKPIAASSSGFGRSSNK